MKKTSTLKTLLSMTAAAGLFWGAGCSDDPKTEPPKKAQTEQKVLTPEEIKQARINKIYVTMRDMSCNMTYRPYSDKGVVKVGFGTPIEDPTVLANLTLFEPKYGQPVDMAEKRKVIHNVKQTGGTMYRTNAASVCIITKDYLKKAEEKALRLIPNYLTLPVDVQTVVLQTELLTNGKLETYKNFCAKINAGRFEDAANECGIKGLKHASFNQDRRDMLRRHGNSGLQTPPAIYASKTLERE